MRGSCTSSSSRAPPSKTLRRSATSQVRQPETKVLIGLPRPRTISVGAAQVIECGSRPGAAILDLPSLPGLPSTHEVSIATVLWGDGGNHCTVQLFPTMVYILQRNPRLTSGS